MDKWICHPMNLLKFGVFPPCEFIPAHDFIRYSRVVRMFRFFKKKYLDKNFVEFCSHEYMTCVFPRSKTTNLRIMVVKDGLMDSRDQSVKGNTLFMYFCKPLLLMHS